MALQAGRSLDARAAGRFQQHRAVVPSVASFRCSPQLPKQCKYAHVSVGLQRACIRTRSSSTDGSSTSAAASSDSSSEVGIHEVEELRGIRANLDGQEPVVEYRVHWKDGSPDTWELASNVSPDLIRDFDERWWAAAKKGDIEAISSMLSYGKDILSQVVDENRRSALHFVAAIGNVKCIKLLADAGADLSLQDKEGYTPLHMACGYMQTVAMSTLLEAGADPLVKDKQGRDVVTLVDNLRRSMPPSMGALQRIMALEQVAGGLTDRLYEEVEPDRILDERPAAAGEGREFLVQYKDDAPDEWVPEALLAPDLVEDWSSGLERVPVAALLDVQQWGTSREYLVQWADGSKETWEPEEHVPAELVYELQEAQPELFKGLKLAGGKKKKKKSKAKQQQQEQQQQQQNAVATEQPNSSSNSSSSSSGSSSAAGHQRQAGSSNGSINAGLVQPAVSDLRERETVSAG